MASSKDIQSVGSKQFTIGQQHIDDGTPGCVNACAGVLAVQDRFDAIRVKIHNGWVAFTIGQWRYEFKVPLKLKEFLDKYDAPGGKAHSKPTLIRLKDGVMRRAARTGGAKDKTEHLRHAPGGRMSRVGYKGKRKVLITKKRVAGSAVYHVLNIAEAKA